MPDIHQVHIIERPNLGALEKEINRYLLEDIYVPGLNMQSHARMETIQIIKEDNWIAIITLYGF